jgi:hypothetical protein
MEQAQYPSKTEIHFKWGEGRLAVSLSFVLFSIAAALCLWSFFIRYELTPFFFFCFFLVVAISRGYDLALALFRSPRKIFIDNATISGTMLGGKRISVAFKDIDHIYKRSVAPFGGLFSIYFESHKSGQSLLLPDNAKWNQVLCDLIKQSNPNCQIDIFKNRGAT